eukprot:655309-Amphidinium_carterae.4
MESGVKAEHSSTRACDSCRKDEAKNGHRKEGAHRVRASSRRSPCSEGPSNALRKGKFSPTIASSRQTTLEEEQHFAQAWGPLQLALMKATVGEIKEATRTFHAMIDAVECGDGNRKFAQYQQSTPENVHAIMRNCKPGTAAQTIELFHALLYQVCQRGGRGSCATERINAARSASAMRTMQHEGCALILDVLILV